MIAHTGLAVRDFKAAKKFYESALAPLGYTAKMQHADATGFNDGKNTDFWIGKGDNVGITVKLIAPIAMEEGLRFAIREGGRTVGAGVVAKIIE